MQSSLTPFAIPVEQGWVSFILSFCNYKVHLIGRIMSKMQSFQRQCCAPVPCLFATLPSPTPNLEGLASSRPDCSAYFDDANYLNHKAFVTKVYLANLALTANPLCAAQECLDGSVLWSGSCRMGGTSRNRQ